MIDQHVHSNYSPDSKESIRNYLSEAKRYGCEYLTLTDHFDFLKVLENSSLEAEFKNFDKLFEEVESINDKSIKIGIEVGYNKLAIEEINQMLKKYDFSLVLLSVHDDDNDQLRYYSAKRSNKSPEEVIKQYIDQIEESIVSNIDFDVITHVGYIFRYFDGKVNPLDYIDYYDNVLKELAKRNKALELNTGCIRRIPDQITEFYIELFKRFKKYGGKFVSIGSDAHDQKSFMYGFDIASSILLKAGFTQSVQIVDRNFTLIDLEIPTRIPDQHMHSNFSPDSKVTIEEYLKRMEILGVEYITITDHLDILKNLEKYSHHDYFGAFERLFNMQLDDRVKIGIEVGYNSTTETEAIELLKKYDFSLVILSCHDNDIEKIKYCRVNDLPLTEDEIVTLFTNQIEASINSNIDFDIVGHLGFVLRYLDGVDPTNHVDKFENILQQVIDKGKIIEFNTSCFYYGTENIEAFYKELFSKYFALGGRFVSIGSDSHDITSYSRDFNYAVKFLKDIGFTSVTIVKDRQYNQLEI